MLWNEVTLYYVRDKQHREIDFVICRENRPISFIEAKLSDAEPSNQEWDSD